MLNLNPELIEKKIVQGGLEWAEANAKASLWEECFRTELNRLVQEYIGTPDITSMAAAESAARADSRCADYIKKMVNARKVANDAKVRYEAAKMWFEASRSVAATERQEMHMAPSHK